MQEEIYCMDNLLMIQHSLHFCEYAIMAGKHLNKDL